MRDPPRVYLETVLTVMWPKIRLFTLFSSMVFVVSMFPWSSEYPWSLWIWTSDLPGAGTDTSVILQIYGELGRSDEMKLDNKTNNFEQGQLDKFVVIRVFRVKILLILVLTETPKFQPVS